MRGRRAWTLVELLVVVAIVGLLMAILMPSLGQAQRLAVLGACAAQMHDVGAAVTSYAAVYDQQLPPFAFSTPHPDAASLPLSGHWGGVSQPGDPAGFGRLGVDSVNLWSLTRAGQTAPAALICPGAPSGLDDGRASYFDHSIRFSTYCVRFPGGEDVFSAAPSTWDRWGMGIYRMAAGGQRVPPGTCPPGVPRERVPLVRLDGQYRLPDAGGGGTYDVGRDVLLADTFWLRGVDEPPAANTELASYPRRADWCHGEWFNALRGDGSVRRARDDGTIAEAIADPPGDDAWDAATAARIWAYFDAAD